VSPRLGFAIAAIASSCGAYGCGASTQEVQAATYAAAEQVCVAQATSYDGGLACIAGVKQVFCGVGGVFADAGVCPDGGER
jgi:hypothetical protein